VSPIEIIVNIAMIGEEGECLLCGQIQRIGAQFGVTSLIIGSPFSAFGVEVLVLEQSCGRSFTIIGHSFTRWSKCWITVSGG